MDPIDFIERNSNYLAYGAFAATMLLSIILLSPAALAISAVSLAVAIAYSRSSHIINPILARRHGIVLVGHGYRLSENPKVAVRDDGPLYKGVCVAHLIPNSRITNSGEKFEEIIAKCRFPFEFSMQVAENDLKSVVDALETRRRMKEIEISRTRASKSDELGRLRRELAIIESEITEITKGKRPTGVVLKVKSGSSGPTESAAANSALSQLEQLCSLFSATYNLGHRVLSGEELLSNMVN
ncbi:MAG: hypothetical protein KGH54_00360 [Candidatus Micrarchaeota archaeon]|nr:hypothetical protein [Candidatus Micrarchaeota archaeon]